MSKFIGYTGRVGVGKSSVLKELARLIPLDIIDSDKIVEELYASGNMEIATKLGVPILTKAEVKKTIKCADDLKRVTNVFAPYINAEIQKQRNTAKHGTIILDAPLLFEFDLHLICDYSVNIYVSSPEIAFLRATTRKNPMSPELFDKISKAQMSDIERNKLATYRVLNDGAVSDAVKEIMNIIAKER